MSLKSSLNGIETDLHLHIAVCEDELNQAQYIKMLAARWVDEHSYKATIDIFDNADSFKTARNENISYDILLLDIQLDGKEESQSGFPPPQNGISLAKELRETDDKLIIVFITALPEYIQEGYDVSALHYLLKPIDEDKLFAVLDKAVKNLSKTDKMLFLPIDGEIVRIPVSNILYIESFAHYMEITALFKKFTVKMPIYEIERQLGGDFIRCHRSYIVGLKHISKITKTDVILDDGKTIPLSRRLYDEVSKTFIKYFNGAE